MKQLLLLLFIVSRCHAQGQKEAFLNISLEEAKDSTTLYLGMLDYGQPNVDFTKDVFFKHKDQTIRTKITKMGQITFNKTKIFITTGDNVDLTINVKSNKLSAKGKNFGNYVFWQQLESVKTDTIVEKDYPYNMLLLRSKLIRNYTIRKRLLDSFNTKRLVSKTFYDYASTELYYSYLFNLILATKILGLSISDLPEGYLQEFNKSNFSDGKKMQSMNYCFALVQYATNVLTHREVGQYDSTHLVNCIKNIKANYRSFQKDFLLSFVFKQYCLKQLAGYDSLLRVVYNNLTNEISDTFYHKMVKKYYDTYLIVNKPLPDEILAYPLITYNGDTTNLKALVNNQDCIIDFWATWCGPCIEGINYYLQKKPLADSAYNILLLSLDATYLAFSRKRFGPEIKAFFVSEADRQKIIDYFSIESYPKSILIQKNVVKNTTVSLDNLINKL